MHTANDMKHVGA